MNFNEARENANVATRAKSLFADGYTVEAWGEGTDLYEVTSPAKKTYIVDTDKQTCSCPYFKKNDGKKECKHLQGITKLLSDTEAAEAALLAQYDEEQNYEGIDGSNGGGWNW